MQSPPGDRSLDASAEAKCEGCLPLVRWLSVSLVRHSGLRKIGSLEGVQSPEVTRLTLVLRRCAESKSGKTSKSQSIR